MLITKQILEQGKSSNGGYSVKQIQHLGLKNYLRAGKGWKMKLIGSDVSKERINRFLALKDAHLISEPILFEDQQHLQSMRL